MKQLNKTRSNHFVTKKWLYELCDFSNNKKLKWKYVFKNKIIPINGHDLNSFNNICCENDLYEIMTNVDFEKDMTAFEQLILFPLLKNLKSLNSVISWSWFYNNILCLLPQAIAFSLSRNPLYFDVLVPENYKLRNYSNSEKIKLLISLFFNKDQNQSMFLNLSKIILECNYTIYKISGEEQIYSNIPIIITAQKNWDTETNFYNFGNGLSSEDLKIIFPFASNMFLELNRSHNNLIKFKNLTTNDSWFKKYNSAVINNSCGYIKSCKK